MSTATNLLEFYVTPLISSESRPEGLRLSGGHRSCVSSSRDHYIMESLRKGLLGVLSPRHGLDPAKIKRKMGRCSLPTGGSSTCGRVLTVNRYSCVRAYLPDKFQHSTGMYLEATERTADIGRPWSNS